MSDHDHSAPKPKPSGSFWTSRTGVVLIAFLAVAGLLLVYEHRAAIGMAATDMTSFLERQGRAG